MKKRMSAFAAAGLLAAALGLPAVTIAAESSALNFRAYETPHETGIAGTIISQLDPQLPLHAEVMKAIGLNSAADLAQARQQLQSEDAAVVTAVTMRFWGENRANESVIKTLADARALEIYRAFRNSYSTEKEEFNSAVGEVEPFSLISRASLVLFTMKKARTMENALAIAASLDINKDWSPMDDEGISSVPPDGTKSSVRSLLKSLSSHPKSQPNAVELERLELTGTQPRAWERFFGPFSLLIGLLPLFQGAATLIAPSSFGNSLTTNQATAFMGIGGWLCIYGGWVLMRMSPTRAYAPGDSQSSAPQSWGFALGILATMLGGSLIGSIIGMSADSSSLLASISSSLSRMPVSVDDVIRISPAIVFGAIYLKMLLRPTPESPDGRPNREAVQSDNRWKLGSVGWLAVSMGFLGLYLTVPAYSAAIIIVPLIILAIGLFLYPKIKFTNSSGGPR